MSGCNRLGSGLYAACLIALAVAGTAADNPAQALAQQWLALQPLTTLPPLTHEHAAYELQDQVVTRLKARLGPVVGYKVALTNPAARCGPPPMP